MSPEEIAAVRAAMYMVPDEIEELDDDGEVVINPLSKPLGQQPMSVAANGKYVTFTVDGKPFTVPSVEYVQSLEKRIAQQDREILKLRNTDKQLRGQLNVHTNELNSVNRELDKKVNLRGDN